MPLWLCEGADRMGSALPLSRVTAPWSWDQNLVSAKPSVPKWNTRGMRARLDFGEGVARWRGGLWIPRLGELCN